MENPKRLMEDDAPVPPEYTGQNGFDSLDRIKYHTCHSKGWWYYYAAVVGSMYTLVILGVCYRAFLSCVHSIRGIHKVLRRLKRLIGIRRKV